MSVTITSESVVKIIVRNGTNSDRLKVILSNGELGYATDSKRLFIGDGVTVGGNSVGGKNFGNYGSAYTNIQSPVAQPGDTIFDGTTLYSYTSGNNWVPAANLVTFDNSTITYNSHNNAWSVNQSLLSGGAAYAQTLSGVATTIQSNSASWNQAAGLYMPGNSVYINSNNATAPQYGKALTINQGGYFLGFSTGPLGAVNIAGVNGIQTNLKNATRYEIDGSALVTSINSISSQVHSLSSQLMSLEKQFTTDITKINSEFNTVNTEITAEQKAINLATLTNKKPTEYYVESCFVYAIDTHKGTAGLSNMWQNVFANQGCDPLRLSVTTGDRPRVVRVDARVNFHFNNHADTVYARLATFPTALPTDKDKLAWGGVNGTFPLLKSPFTAYSTSTVPLAVLDTVTASAPKNDKHNMPVNLSSTYTIPPNSTVVFGLQHFIHCSSQNKDGSFVEINGWHSGDSNDGISITRNLVGFTGKSNRLNYPTNLPAYKGWYAWGNNPTLVNGVAQHNGAPGSTTVHPQTEFGICDGDPNSPFVDAVDIINGQDIFQSKFWGVKNTSIITAVFLN
jgi:Major tropism determinant N-terminal domain